ncbi:MAG TPA: hypothetical protein VF461_04075 [Gemmatimonadaceae bacterium]
MPSSTTRWRFALVVLGVAGAAVGLMTTSGYPVGAVVDDAMYVILAKALATGQGYRSLNLPGAPFNTHFPPGYPAVLSLLWRAYPAFPENLLLFKIFNALCLGAIGAGAARLLYARGVARGWALGFGLVVAVSVPLLLLTSVLLSEPFFLALLLFLLPALEGVVEGADAEPGQRGAAWRAFGCGLAIGLVSLVRTHGFVLIPAMLLVLGWKRRWRLAALLAAGAMTCLLPWQLWIARHSEITSAPLAGAYDSYTGWWIRGIHAMGWAMVPRTLSRTVPETLQMFAIVFSPSRAPAAHTVTLLLLGALAVAGVAVAARRAPVTLLFMAGYLGIVAVWPYQPGRFVWGIWPLLLALPFVAALRVGASTNAWRRPVSIGAAAAFCWLVAGYASYEWRGIRGRWWESIPRSGVGHIQFAVGWTRANTAPTDIVSTEDEGPVYLYTGRRTLPVRAFTVANYLEDESAEKMAANGLEPLLATYPIRAVLTSTRGADAIARLLAESPSPRLIPAGTFPGGAAYTVVRRSSD